MPRQKAETLKLFSFRLAERDMSGLKSIAASHGITASDLARQLIASAIADYQMEKNRENTRQ